LLIGLLFFFQEDFFNYLYKSETIYSPNYSEEKWRKIKLKDDMNTVLELLGNPIYVTIGREVIFKFKNSILYSKKYSDEHWIEIKSYTNKKNLLHVFMKSVKNKKNIIFQYSASKNHSSYISRMIIFSWNKIVVQKVNKFYID